jgi:hypothetical protein
VSSLRLEELADVVADLMGEAPREVRQIAGGGNNLVARADLAAGPVLVKAYHYDAGDPRDRLGTEYPLLSHLWDQGLRSVPQPLCADAARHVGIYGFVEGEAPTPESLGAQDVCALADLLGAMWELKGRPGADTLPTASEATFSARSLLDLLRLRRERLREQMQGDTEGAQALGFLRDELTPALEDVEARLAEEGDLEAELPASERTLSPSDVGFHNALRGPTGWVFFDFEYGGWDDPAKALADSCLSPAVRMPAELRPVFLEAALPQLGSPLRLAARLERLYPLWSLKWCLILLNEFLPQVRERRQRATGAVRGAELRRAKLAEARARLQELRDPPPLLPPGVRAA